MTVSDFFFSPVLRAPMFGVLLMGFSSSLIGVLLFLQRKTLVSESLSHSTYPGIVVTAGILGLFSPRYDDSYFPILLAGAFLTSLCALKMISFLQEKRKVHADAALCFVLSLFFGVGIVATSVLQFVFPSYQMQIQTLLFGQAATMTDMHVFFYGILAIFVIALIALFFSPLQSLMFDRDFSKSIGIKVKWLDTCILCLLLLSLVLGMRSVGLVLMSGMVIAPAVAARQFTNRLQTMFVLSAVFGVGSSFLGMFLSVQGSLSAKVSFPTGPMIVLMSGFLAVFSLLLAPKRGLVFRKLRVGKFFFRCMEENILKSIWKRGPVSRTDLGASWFVLRRLLWQKWVEKKGRTYHLTESGKIKAGSIVRLHRLWELYLASMLKIQSEKIHKTAEEMEHILTPDIEERLTKLLANPTKDPHEQPIPERI